MPAFSILVLLLTLFSSPQKPEAFKAKQPNTLFLIADNWSFPHAGVYGDPATGDLRASDPRSLYWDEVRYTPNYQMEDFDFQKGVEDYRIKPSFGKYAKDGIPCLDINPKLRTIKRLKLNQTLSATLLRFSTKPQAMRLQGKTAIITGATSGMGKAMAERFVSEGASVILSGRNEHRGKELEKNLIQQGGKAVFIAGDISQIAVNETLVREAIQNFGKLDIVVTNAGKLGLGSVTDISFEEWNETISTNLNSVFYLSRFAIPEMQKNGKGIILANSSIAAFKSFPNHAAYCASKAALVALVKEMALDYGPTIRVNTICPGPVDTPLIWDSAKAFDDPDTIVQQTANNTLMKRLGNPEDIASLALFLVSDEASWITGSAYTSDGGISVK